jgi:polyhydroxyalkanoate synthase
LNDNIPLPGEVYREFAKYLFQQNLLTKNRMPLGRHIVDLRKITCPLLNLMARKRRPRSVLPERAAERPG